MAIKQEPFRRYHEEKKTDTFTVKLNAEERMEFESWKKMIHQEKDSTAIKQLSRIGAEVLLDKKMMAINKTILNNYRKNKRLGVVTFE
jgi:orotidine-5'-phosphate decarboxylase